MIEYEEETVEDLPLLEMNNGSLNHTIKPLVDIPIPLLIKFIEYLDNWRDIISFILSSKKTFQLLEKAKKYDLSNINRENIHHFFRVNDLLRRRKLALKSVDESDDNQPVKISMIE